MRCTYPRTVGYQSDGRTLAWSPKQYCKEYATFQVACGQCIDCKLDHSQMWAVRALHEAQMHADSCFITLTYSDERLESPWLIYKHYQDFMKRLRDKSPNQLSFMVCGEYGEKTKRPHWHALIFGYQFPDLQYLRKNENDDRIFTSRKLDELWGFNDPENKPCEVGAVTFQSAGYVARYGAKALVHGRPGEHPYKPIFRVSNKRAIGKSWLEKYWYSDVFANGRLNRGDGVSIPIPRYYLKWLEKEHPNEWRRYVTEVKVRSECKAAERASKEAARIAELRDERSCRTAKDGAFRPFPTTGNDAKRAISKQRFERLQEKLKL